MTYPNLFSIKVKWENNLINDRSFIRKYVKNFKGETNQETILKCEIENG